jgi:hypothetical protein
VVRVVFFAGYGTIVSLIILMFGILFFILGILGEYIARIYEEVKQRPNFVVRDAIGLGIVIEKIGFDGEGCAC